MTKELFILFVYDTQLCLKEEDDPQDAVLYFYPNWVTDQQRLALCGQLMGATQFYLSAFSCPRIISLNSGKFAIKEYGRYLIAIGTDRNAPDWVIDHRSNILHYLLQLYHRDLDTIMKNSNLSGNSFRDKLSQIFETFLPVIQYAVDVFVTIPTIRLPKSASNVFLEAIQILHCCQEKNGVLGGAVLYQNRVVATQLCASLTKSLVSTDPYRIKSPAESIFIPFHLPVGVQLLKVYIENGEYSKLFQDASSARSAYANVTKKKEGQKRVPSSSSMGKPSVLKEQTTSMMKRDISRIFTVPEEEGEMDISEDFNIATVNKNYANQRQSSSQCTTPMKEVNLSKVLHERVLSICKLSENDENDSEDKLVTSKVSSIPVQVPDIVKDTIISQTNTAKLSKTKTIPHFLLNCCDAELYRWKSMTEIHHHAKPSSNRVPLRSYSFGLPRLTQDLLEEEFDDSQEDDLPSEKHYYNTITDPFYPVFRCDGLPISRSLFDEHLARHYKMLVTEKSSPLDMTPIDLKSDMSKKMPCNNEKNEINDCVKENMPLKDTEARNETTKLETSKQELYRRSLSLPLKNITSESNDDARRKSTAFPAGILESPSVRTRMMGTLPLTPLMSKLSSLAMEDRSSGFCSRDATPGDFKDFGVITDNFKSRIPSKINKHVVGQMESEKKVEKAPDAAVLYVFGQQSMALLLILEENAGSDPDLIHSLWETSVGSLNRLEAHLRKCLEPIAQGTDAESYSYICLDPRWDMLQRGGPWGCLELDMVASLHHDFKETNSLTEIVVRCEDTTVYGYQCGKTEIFYQQPSSATAGLPTPSDLMGVVPLKARRRLERDHGIVLL